MKSIRRYQVRSALAGVCGFLLMPAITYGQNTEFLSAGDRVRLLRNGDYRVATLVRATADSIMYRPEGGTTFAITARSVSALDVSNGTRGHAGQGALIGAGVGLGLALFAIASAGDPTRRCVSCSPFPFRTL